MTKPKKIGSDILTGGSIRYRTYYHDIIPGAFLTVKEKECLWHLDPVSIYADVAEKMNISRRTVEAYIRKIKKKFQCRSRYDLLQLRAEVFYDISKYKHEI